MSMVNCNMFCHMKNGQRWLHTADGQEIRVHGFADAAGEDFVEENVKKLVFSAVPNLKKSDVVSVVVDNNLAYGFDNVEEIKFDGVKYVHISKHFPNLKKVAFSQEVVSFDLHNLWANNMQEIVFPGKYWQPDFYYYSSAKKTGKPQQINVDKFPKGWSKELKEDLVVHFPFLISALDFVPQNRAECDELYVKVCDEAIRRGNERAKTEPKELVVADEAKNLEMVQRWLSSCNVKNESVEESLKSVANSNGFGYVPKNEK